MMLWTSVQWPRNRNKKWAELWGPLTIKEQVEEEKSGKGTERDTGEEAGGSRERQHLRNLVKKRLENKHKLRHVIGT